MQIYIWKAVCDPSAHSRCQRWVEIAHQNDTGCGIEYLSISRLGWDGGGFGWLGAEALLGLQIYLGDKLEEIMSNLSINSLSNQG